MKTFIKTALMCAMLTMPALPVSAQAEDQPARPAKVFTASVAPATLQRTYPAIVLPSREVQLTFRVSGRVIDLPARGSMPVEEGDVIARLDPSDFETQLAQLQSTRDQAAAELRALRSGARPEEVLALEAAVDAAQAQVDQALEQVTRTRELAERGVVATARLDEDEATLRVAQANLRAEIEQLTIGQSGGRQEDIEAAEAAIRALDAQVQSARNNLDYATLRAPFAGVIGRRDIDNFTNVQAGQDVALLQALSTVHLTFDIPGPDVTALVANGRENIENKVIFDALPGQVFDSEVVEFSVQADTATQTYRGRVAVDIPEDALILPGMVGRVISTAPGNAQNLMVPLTAVAAGTDGSPLVWVVGDDDTVSPRAITLGDLAGESVAVTTGLEDGDVIVSAGVSQIIEGMRIRPVTRIGG